MATIKDIAKAAGVSHGTVSNVFNRKGNVSAEKIRLVEETALAMGYNINANAKLLRKGVSNNIAIVIPDNEIHRYRDLYKNISTYMDERGYSSNIYITEDVPHKEKDIIRNILSNRVHSIVVISCLDKHDDFYSHVVFGDSKIIFVERQLNVSADKSYFVAYDAVKIGCNIARYVQSKQCKSIIFFSNRKIYSFDNDIFTTLKRELSQKEISIDQYSCDTRLNILTAFEIVFSENKYDMIVTTSKEKAKILNDVMTLSSTRQDVKILTLASTSILRSHYFKEYELNYKKLGTTIGKGIIEGFKKARIIEDPLEIPERYERKNHRKKEIHILCAKGPSEDALRYVSQLILSTTGIHAHIQSRNYDELFDMIAHDRVEDTIDLIRFDMAWLSHFGNKMFIPIDEIDFDFTGMFDSFIPGIEEEYSIVDGRQYALPFDPSMLLLFYRKDLFEDPVISRLYFEKYKTKLKPPKNYEEYNHIASFFTQAEHPESVTKNGTTMTISSPQSVACHFLAVYHYMSKGLSTGNTIHLNYNVLNKSIKNLLETLSYADIQKQSFWDDAMRQFASGDSAMAITFSNRASNVINSKVSDILGKFDFKTLPGKQHIIGGGVLGISRKSSHVQTTCQFLEQFYSKKISLIFASLCGASSSKYVFENEEISQIYPWLRFVQKNLKHGRRKIIGKSFNRHDFEYNIGTSLINLYNKKINKDECLLSISKMFKSASQ